MDKYTVKLYARAYRDIDGIYTYIAENLLSPDTALNMVDELGNRFLVWKSFRSVAQSAVQEPMQTGIIDSCS